MGERDDKTPSSLKAATQRERVKWVLLCCLVAFIQLFAFACAAIAGTAPTRRSNRRPKPTMASSMQDAALKSLSTIAVAQSARIAATNARTGSMTLAAGPLHAAPHGAASAPPSACWRPRCCSEALAWISTSEMLQRRALTAGPPRSWASRRWWCGSAPRCPSCRSRRPW